MPSSADEPPNEASKTTRAFSNHDQRSVPFDTAQQLTGVSPRLIVDVRGLRNSLRIKQLLAATTASR